MYEVKQIEKGHLGLFATKDIRDGAIILYLTKDSTFLSYPTRTSIQVEDRHLEHYEGGCTNHHCNPNARVGIYPNFQGQNPGAQWEVGLAVLLVAKKNIEVGEEITFDYETTEEELAKPFKCNCHGRWIRGKSK